MGGIHGQHSVPTMPVEIPRTIVPCGTSPKARKDNEDVPPIRNPAAPAVGGHGAVAPTRGTASMPIGDSNLHDTLTRVDVDAREPRAACVRGNTGGAATIGAQTA